MRKPTTRAAKGASAARERLRASPNFAQMLAFDGRPYVARDSEPYVQYWLTERYRLLLALFSGKRGATIEEAMRGYFRLVDTAPTEPARKRLAAAIADMRAAEVLIGARDDVSRYDASIVEAYLTHRPFPPDITAFIARAGAIGRESRVLDLAGGPGDLALQLARICDNVTLMELSSGFVASARVRAKQAGLRLEALQESCNRLVYMDDSFDVVTVAQALHWLDDVMMCRGVCRLLRPAGSFFVVHGAMEMPDEHPLAFLFGSRSILGEKKPVPFADELKPLRKRLALLFEALDSPDVARVDLAASGHGERVAPAGVTIFRQRRPVGVGFARAFLTPKHIAITGMAPTEFWRDVETRCARATRGQLGATAMWGVLRFQRGGAELHESIADGNGVIDIGYGGPPEG